MKFSEIAGKFFKAIFCTLIIIFSFKGLVLPESEPRVAKRNMRKILMNLNLEDTRIGLKIFKSTNRFVLISYCSMIGGALLFLLELSSSANIFLFGVLIQIILIHNPIFNPVNREIIISSSLFGIFGIMLY